jgi:hypothetical protein
MRPCGTRHYIIRDEMKGAHGAPQRRKHERSGAGRAQPLA